MKRFGVLMGTAGILFAGGFLATSPTLAGCSSDSSSSAAPVGTLGSQTDTGSMSSLDGGLPATDSLPPSSGNEGGVSMDGSCGGTELKASARDAHLLLVLDKSGSMLQVPTGFPTKKWDALRTALRDSLTAAQNRIGLGLMMYPHDPAGPIAEGCTTNCCTVPSGSAAITVPIAPGTTTVTPILNAVDTAAPGGATPTAKALAEAHAYFTTGAGKDLKGDRYIILATDGGPNCNTALTCEAATCTTNIDNNCTPTGANCCDPSRSKISCLDDAAVKTQLEALKAAGVMTFVIGIPGTEAYAAYLDQFAEAGGMVNTGGTTKYFAVAAAGGVAGLTEVFAKITGELITTCTLTLESAPPNVNEVNVLVDDKPVPQGGDNGWALDGLSITLKGQTCEDVKTKGAKIITVTYGCPTIR